MGQNVRHIMFKYNMTHLELLYTHVSTIKHKCKEMWNINVNATYYELVLHKNENASKRRLY